MSAYTRIPYRFLDPGAQQDIHAWCELMGIDYKRIPIDTDFELDETTNEWRIEMYVEGYPLNVTNDDIVRVVVRRANVLDLPWPTLGDMP